MKYYSQYGQDILLSGLFYGKNDGVFVDIGAYDGIKLSNTYIFEQRGWKGVCVEPNPETFKRLVRNRKCDCDNYAVLDVRGLIRFNINKTCDFMSGCKLLMLSSNQKFLETGEHASEELAVPCIPINEFLENHKLKDIDLMSIDIEGGEHLIIKALDFDKYNIKVLCIENNDGYGEIFNILYSHGYTLLVRLGQDSIYVKDINQYLEGFSYIDIIYKKDS